jgi:DNA-binding NarL/FixJ family response regulator
MLSAISHNAPASVKERKLGLEKAAKEPAGARPATLELDTSVAWQTQSIRTTGGATIWRNMSTTGSVEQGRAAYERRDWATAYECLALADRETSLSADDLFCLAAAAHLTRSTHEDTELWTRAHYAFLRDGRVDRAVRCAFYLGFAMLIRGDHAQGNGWLARGERILEENALDCVEAGYLAIPRSAFRRWNGDFQASIEGFQFAHETGRRFGDADLIAFSRMGTGEALVGMGETARGWALLDETLAALTTSDMSPLIVGVIYCAVLSCCQRNLDVRRSQEWTDAFMRWCDSQPGLVPYRGDCQVYRAEVLQMRGAWPNAMEEARRACDGASDPSRTPWLGGGFYQQAELCRLRGDYQAAEEAYRTANQWGHTPQPGLSLLRLAQGRADVAASALERAVAEPHEPTERARLLAAYVEVLLSLRRTDDAVAAAEQLREAAAASGSPVLGAIAGRALGAIQLARGDAAAALSHLRAADGIWHSVDVPYEAARTRVLIALACRSLGDEDGAQLDLEAARTTFARLGAVPDLVRVDALLLPAELAARGSPLTPRELEVLRLIAAGHSNRAIAESLVLSEKTVARHVSNIFARLGLSSRSAATAYAYEHHLV